MKAIHYYSKLVLIPINKNKIVNLHLFLLLCNQTSLPTNNNNNDKIKFLIVKGKKNLLFHQKSHFTRDRKIEEANPNYFLKFTKEAQDLSTWYPSKNEQVVFFFLGKYSNLEEISR